MMSRSVSIVTASAAMFLMLLSGGCAIRPGRVAPEHLTLTDVYAILDARRESIRDFAGRALVKANRPGENVSSATISLKYLAPGRLRMMVKGFAGITGAVITAAGDSVKAYFPGDNTFVADTALNPVIAGLFPGINPDPRDLAGHITGLIPSPSRRISWDASLVRDGRKLVLRLEREGFVHAFELDGPELAVVREWFNDGGDTVWTRTASRFKVVDGILLPSRIVYDGRGGILDVGFSEMSVNSGVTAMDVTFTIPRSAERIRF